MNGMNPIPSAGPIQQRAAISSLAAIVVMAASVPGLCQETRSTPSAGQTPFSKAQPLESEKQGSPDTPPVPASTWKPGDRQEAAGDLSAQKTRTSEPNQSKPRGEVNASSAALSPGADGATTAPTDGSGKAQSNLEQTSAMTVSEPSSEASRPTRTPKIIWKPGLELSAGTGTEDLVPTDDVELARKQVAAYPDSPEASFILAVALTRTSHVEEALQEVRRARKLAEAKGGPVYFDKMIATYEEMLKHHPKENRVRYGLAWAYYMKAYLLAKYSRRATKAAAAQSAAAPAAKSPSVWELAASAANGKIPANAPHIPSALEKADPAFHPQIKKYYELALARLNELLAQQPDDIWARVYRAFLKAEYSGNLEEAMNEWRNCQAKAPDNPAPYFFLGEAYLKQGNLKECINNISKAIALRAVGK